MRFLVGFLLFFLLTQGHIHAQGTSKFQIWTDFNPSFDLSEKWRLGGDIGYRIATSVNSQTAYIRPIIGFKLNKTFSLAAGVASFNSWDDGMFTKAEIRTFEFLLISWPNIGGFTFKHRLGMEQRWHYLPGYDLSDYVNRSRYYLELKSPKFSLFNISSLFFVMANFEILRDLNNNELGRLADHNRYTIGAGNQVTDNFRAEVRFKIINTVDPLAKSFIREISVVRVRLYYHFSST
jgi:hypothetical protein